MNMSQSSRAELILDALPEETKQGIFDDLAELVQRHIMRVIERQEAQPKRARNEARNLRAI